MGYELEKLFPVTIYKSKINYQFSDQEADRILQGQYHLLNNGSLSDEKVWVLDEPPFSNFKKILQSHVDVYAKEIFKYTDCEVYITTSWLNINPTNSYHNLHTHTNSIFSGVYYITLPPGAPFLSFTSPRRPALAIVPEEWNEHNSPYWTLEVTEGELVIFPSEVFHEVLTNFSNTTRISLAFNTFVKGAVGEKSTYQEIK